MIEKVYRATCTRCLRAVILSDPTLNEACKTLKIAGWKRLADTNICPACQALIGNVQVIPDGETKYAQRH